MSQIGVQYQHEPNQKMVVISGAPEWFQVGIAKSTRVIGYSLGRPSTRVQF